MDLTEVDATLIAAMIGALAAIIGGIAGGGIGYLGARSVQRRDQAHKEQLQALDAEHKEQLQSHVLQHEQRMLRSANLSELCKLAAESVSWGRGILGLPDLPAHAPSDPPYRAMQLIISIHIPELESYAQDVWTEALNIRNELDVRRLDVASGTGTTKADAYYRDRLTKYVSQMDHKYVRLVEAAVNLAKSGKL